MNRKPYILLLSALFLHSCSPMQDKHQSLLMKPKEFQAAMKADKDYILLDCRTPEEVNNVSIEGNTNIDYHAPDYKQQLDKLNKNKTVYIYCRSGNRSHKSAVMMQEMHFKKVVDLDGGITAWEGDGLPVK